MTSINRSALSRPFQRCFLPFFPLAIFLHHLCIFSRVFYVSSTPNIFSSTLPKSISKLYYIRIHQRAVRTLEEVKVKQARFQSGILRPECLLYHLIKSSDNPGYPRLPAHDVYGKEADVQLPSSGHRRSVPRSLIQESPRCRLEDRFGRCCLPMYWQASNL